MNSKILIFLCLLAAHSSYSQIKNVSLLYPFFEKLVNLEKNKEGKINIVHIGDSHIQADIFTNAIREPLQQQFGDGGRGFIFPYTLNKTTNGPYSFFTNATWQTCRNSLPSKCTVGTELGLSGYGFSTKTEEFTLSVEANEERYNFNTIKIVSPTTSSYRLAMVNGDEKPISAIHLLPTQKQAIYNLNGLIVEKDAPGLIYHAVGSIGATASNFNATPLFFEQLPLLSPDLVIISFGTNESFNNASAENFIASLEQFINNIKMFCPNVPVLVTTPQFSYFHRKKFNTYILEYTNALLQKNNIAIWDLYSYQKQLIGPDENLAAIKIANDKIHYTLEGYVNQGTAFVNDFLYEYKKYKGSLE